MSDCMMNVAIIIIIFIINSELRLTGNQKNI